MKLRTRFFAAVLMVASLATFGIAQTDSAAAPPPHARPFMHHGFDGPMLPFFSKQLNLTDAQKTQIKGIFQSAKSTMKPLMQQEHQSHMAMVQLITGGTFDAAKAQTIISQESQVHAQIELQHAQLASQAYQVLTADQKTKLNELITEHEQRMQERMQQHEQGATPEGSN